MSVALIYLLAALAVGSYLILAVAEFGQDTVIWNRWDAETLELGWMRLVALGYGGLALLATVGYLSAMMLVGGYLPAWLCRLVNSIPWIGSTMRSVVLGEFCQTIYLSVLRGQTYGDGLRQASQFVRNAKLRRWSAESSRRIESGQAIARLLESLPMQDSPLAATTAFVANELSVNEPARVWHCAADECHHLALSRLQRTTVVLSTVCLLACVLLAAFPLLLTGSFLQVYLRGQLFL